MTDKEKYDFIDHVVHLTMFVENRLLNEHGGEYSGLEEDGIDSNEYYRIITERVINILKKNNNYMREEPVSSVWHDARKSVPENSISQIICIKEDGLATATEGRIVSGTTKWAYLSDLLNLDNSCNFEKNLQEEPVSDINIEQELYKAFGQVKDFTLGMRIAKWFYDMGKKNQEPVSERFAFKAIPRLLEMIEPSDRAKAYIAKLADTLELEGYSTDAKIVMESLKIMNGEKVAMATMDEEPISEDLGNYINKLSKQFPEVSFAKLSRIAVRVAKWQKEHLWKPADGDDLPIFDREVIALIKYNAQHNIHDEEYPTYRVGFGHRPNPNGWDGKNIETNEVTHYTPKLYDKGGWNAPNIVYWLDVKLPKEIEL